jgi:hypothetical protein
VHHRNGRRTASQGGKNIGKVAVRPPRQRYHNVQLGFDELGVLCRIGHTRRKEVQSAFKQLGNVFRRRVCLVDWAIRKENDLIPLILAKVLKR